MRGSMVPPGRITPGIVVIRGERVMVDVDLAQLYGVPTGSSIKP